MFCSAGYHMFSCQSEYTSKRWLRLDLAGVSVGMCGCYFPGAYYAFYCNKVKQCLPYACIHSCTVVYFCKDGRGLPLSSSCLLRIYYSLPQMRLVC